jgi:hypothetical protein
MLRILSMLTLGVTIAVVQMRTADPRAGPLSEITVKAHRGLGVAENAGRFPQLVKEGFVKISES